MRDLNSNATDEGKFFVIDHPRALSDLGYHVETAKAEGKDISCFCINGFGIVLDLLLKGDVYTGRVKVTGKKAFELNQKNGTLYTPTFSAHKDSLDTIVVTQFFNDKSYSQTFRKMAPMPCSTMYLAVYLAEIITRRLTLSTVDTRPEPSNEMTTLMSPNQLSTLLRSKSFTTKKNHSDYKFELVLDTTKKEIELVKERGMIVKVTQTFYNQGVQKEIIYYYVISVLGRIEIFEGNTPDFSSPWSIGYVKLA